MNADDQRIAIATVCGWTEIEPCTCHNGQFRGFQPTPGAHKKHTPDYLNDLNAMHEAEKMLQQHMEKWWNYVSQLAVVNSTLGTGGEAHATAAQRAEAFLKTLNLWK